MESKYLCIGHANEYRAAGYILERDYKVKLKDECEKCEHQGYAFKVFTPKEMYDLERKRQEASKHRRE